MLVLETMFFADEVRDPGAEIDNLPKRVKLRAEESRMAMQLIKAKKNDREVDVAEQAPKATTVTDLSEALRASVEAGKGQRGRTRRTTGKAKPRRTEKSA